jgi:hypothetical protein
MSLRGEWKPLALIAGVFLAFYLLPVAHERVAGALSEALLLTQWYAREHVLLCLLPAFYIAGAIAVFISQAAVMKYLGPAANRVAAYSVASVAGSVLAVCSCTVLPLFAGIYKRGAGLGPAAAFLYSGPAINVLAIILTARVLGWQLGLARAIGAVVFAIAIGLLMHLLFQREEEEKAAAAAALPPDEDGQPLWRTGALFAVMIALLVFATWSSAESGGVFAAIYGIKWYLAAAMAAVLAVLLAMWYGISGGKLAATGGAVLLLALLIPRQPELAFTAGVLGLAIVLATEPGDGREWLEQSWALAKQIMPLLFAGVLVAGFMLGTPGGEGLIPPQWISGMLGGNSLGANLFASVAGALMYFATLTEIPILEGLLGSGMGEGPALALLLAGPALSLPNMLVIASVLGWKKTLAFVALVIVMATLSGVVYGTIAG